MWRDKRQVSCRSLWTVRESNSRLSDANRVHCHYANGPQFYLFSPLKYGLNDPAIIGCQIPVAMPNPIRIIRIPKSLKNILVPPSAPKCASAQATRPKLVKNQSDFQTSKKPTKAIMIPRINLPQDISLVRVKSKSYSDVYK